MKKMLLMIVIMTLSIAVIVIVGYSIFFNLENQSKLNSSKADIEDVQKDMDKVKSNLESMGIDTSEMSNKMQEHYKDNPISYQSAIGMVSRISTQPNFKRAYVSGEKVYIVTEGITHVYYWQYRNSFGGVDTPAYNEIQNYCNQVNNSNK